MAGARWHSDRPHDTGGLRSSEPAPFRSVELAGGDGQSGVVGTTVAQPLSVRVVRDDGTPEAGVTIHWNWFGPDPIRATLSANVMTTDSAGVAAVRLTLGDAPGRVWVRAALSDGTARMGEVIFTATAVSP